MLPGLGIKVLHYYLATFGFTYCTTFCFSNMNCTLWFLVHKSSHTFLHATVFESFRTSKRDRGCENENKCANHFRSRFQVLIDFLFSILCRFWSSLSFLVCDWCLVLWFFYDFFFVFFFTFAERFWVPCCFCGSGLEPYEISVRLGDLEKSCVEL